MTLFCLLFHPLSIILLFIVGCQCRFITDEKFDLARELPCITPVVPHAFVAIQGRLDVPLIVPPGTQIQITCQAGYSFDNDQEAIMRVCTNDGEWSGNVGKCSVHTTTTTKMETTTEVTMCSANLIENGALLAYTGYKRVFEITSNNWELYPGNRIRLICDPDFVLTDGEEFSYCLIGGVWSDSLGTCTSLKLESPVSPLIGASIKSETAFPQEEIIRHYIGENELESREEIETATPVIMFQSWNEDEFITTAELTTTTTTTTSTTTTPTPTTTTTETTTSTTTPTTTPPTTSTTTTSTSTSTSTTQLPTTTTSTTPMPTTTTSAPKMMWKQTTTLPFGLMSTESPLPPGNKSAIAIVLGFGGVDQPVEEEHPEHIHEHEDREVVALRHGLFNSCGDLPRLTNAVISEGSMLAGSARKVTCNFGYTLIGSENTTCNDAGKWVVNTYCAKACVTLPHIEHAIVEGGGPNQIGVERKFVCKSGYELQGSGLARCQSDGEWKVTGSCISQLKKMMPLKKNMEFTIVYMDEHLGDSVPLNALNVTTRAFRFGLTVFDRVKYISERFNKLYGNYWATVIGPSSTAIAGEYITPNYIRLRRGKDDVVLFKETCSKQKPRLTAIPTSRPLDTSKFYFLSNSHVLVSNATKQDALNFVTLAFKLFSGFDEIASYIQTQFNAAYSGDWLCVVGPSMFDVYFWYEQPLFISIGKVDDIVSVNIIHPPICSQG